MDLEPFTVLPNTTRHIALKLRLPRILIKPIGQGLIRIKDGVPPSWLDASP